MIDIDNIETIKQNVSLYNFIQRHHETSFSYEENAVSTTINPCPICGGNGHFTLLKDEPLYYSFSTNSNCSEKGDVIELASYMLELSKSDTITYLLDTYNLVTQSDNVALTTPSHSKQHTSTKQKEHDDNMTNDYSTEKLNKVVEVGVDYVQNTTYFKSRGLSDDTISRFKLGYLPKGSPQMYAIINQQGQPSKEDDYQLVLPSKDENGNCKSFELRTTDDSKDAKYKNPKGLKPTLINDDYLAEQHPVVFVTEGMFDVLSVEELGYKAIGLRSTQNTEHLLEKLKDMDQTHIVLALDEDEAGYKARQTIENALDNEDVSTIELSGYNDLNEYLLHDREGLRQRLENAYNHATKIDGVVTDYLDQFIEQVSCEPIQPLKTGLESLDDILEGGLMPGLYILGAVSSLGKSAFVQQIGDYVASQNTPVIIGSIEMSKDELLARSFSRLSYQLDETEDFTMSDVLKGQVDSDSLETIKSSYSTQASNTIILDTNITFKRLKNMLKKLTKRHSQALLIIDYLQILRESYNDNLTDKQNMDKNVLELKAIAKSFNIPVLCVSSLNRSHYNSAVTMEAMKESGGIEYSSDVLLGLQPKDINNKNSQTNIIDKHKMEPIREVEVKVLKQRNGQSNGSVNFEYAAEFNHFTPVE